MPFELICEKCGAKSLIDDDLAGKTVRCPKCAAAAESPFGGAGPLPDSTDDVNPYASPATISEGPFAEQAATGMQAITPEIYRAMSQTRPWVLFLSILGFIAGAITGLGGIGIAVVSFASGQPFMLIMGPMYLVYAAAYWGCSYYLLLYAQRIGSLQRTNSIADLEGALVAQKSFWKLMGILMAVMLALGTLAMVGFVVLGAVGAMYF